MQHEISDNLVIDSGELGTLGVAIGGKILYGKGVAAEVAYIKDVQNDLVKIFGTTVGLQVLRGIAGSPKGKMYIMPYIPDYQADLGRCNAFASEPSWDVEGFFDYEADFWGDNIILRYTHSDWSAGSECATTGPGSRPEEILLHEMIHGLRNLYGVSNTRPLGGWMANYDNEEEFYAILLTNIYMSERGQIRMRADHHGFTSLSKPEFFLNNPGIFDLVSKLYQQQPALCANIATVECDFNPLRGFAERTYEAIGSFIRAKMDPSGGIEAQRRTSR